MCVVDPFYTVYIPPIINQYLIGEIQNRVHNYLNLFDDADVPDPVTYLDSIDEAEEALIECLIERRGGSFRAMLNGIHDVGHDLRVFDGSEDQTCHDLTQGTHQPSAWEETIVMNRTAIMNYVRAQSATDSQSAEFKLYLRDYAETFIHEACHHSYSHTGNEDPSNTVYGTSAYWNGSHGQCVINGWSQTVRDVGPAPSYKRFLQGPLDYRIDYCMNIVFSGSQYQDYLKSTHSGSVACDPAPPNTFPEFHPGQKPY